MPELPEVEAFRQYFNIHALNKAITSVNIVEEKILKGSSAEKLLQFCQQAKFIQTSRRGKFMFAKLSSEGGLLFHFGMTGDFRYSNSNEKLHKHDRLVFNFKNGYYLAYISQRKFGRVEYIANIDEYIKSQRFGPDALSITPSELQRQLQGRNRKIKSALLDQKIIAGVGNLYADEALFQAQIRPDRLTKELSADELIRLAKKIKKIMIHAVQQGNEYGEPFSSDYFISFRKKDGCCPICNTLLSRLPIAQRTTYFCEKCQK
ncbi:Formamidopyrimidine-DNA glycosylase [Candidatus Lokiarchaeum ossiferum]|uniref:Formamidopyrimidine-DNA glycosylase n=1 Tax=Candidatus Lokiarchaeum ossiferum TaxID=2951803 RepID=A0ABY6HMY3_9ARCH|nr:Formamidopyrimidine-DNA glycosylase [Candidatus Lokiarchaeum sp. B-35]